MTIISSGHAETNGHPAITWSQLPPMPDKLGMAAPFAGTSGGALIVAGGSNFPHGFPWHGGKKVWHAAVYSLAAPNGQWQTIGQLPRPLAYGVSVTTPSGVLCIGGNDAAQHYQDVRLLEVRGGTLIIRDLPPLFSPLAHSCGALLNDVIYVAGGQEAPDSTLVLRKFWALDLRASCLQWRELEPWPGPARMLAVAAVQDEAFFLMSGITFATDPCGRAVRSYLRDAYRFSPTTGWRRIADVPRPVVAAPSPAASLDGSKILVLGADDGSASGFQPIELHPGFSKKMFVYDALDNFWRFVGEAPVSCVTISMIRWKQFFIIPGGELRPGVRSPYVWAMTPGLSDAKIRYE